MGSRGANSWRAPAPGPVPSPQAAGTLGRVTAPGLSFLTHKVRLLPAGVLELSQGDATLGLLPRHGGCHVI